MDVNISENGQRLAPFDNTPNLVQGLDQLVTLDANMHGIHLWLEQKEVYCHPEAKVEVASWSIAIIDVNFINRNDVEEFGGTIPAIHHEY